MVDIEAIKARLRALYGLSWFTEEQFDKLARYLVFAGVAMPLLENYSGYMMCYLNAPASAGHHLAVKGGLAIHSMNVTDRLLQLTGDLKIAWSDSGSPYVIGEPVKPMVELIKRMHDEGKVVKIMTARVAPHKLEDGTVGESYITVPDGEKGATRNYAHQFINDWCHFNLGFIPEIVYQKDHLMLELYDDRVKQVVPNEGWLVEDIAASKRQKVVIDHVEVVNAKWWDRLNWFFGGTIFMCVVLAILAAVADWTTKPLPEATEKLHEAIHEFMESQRQEVR